LRLLKIGAVVRTSVRCVTVATASGFPSQQEFALARLAAAAEIAIFSREASSVLEVCPPATGPTGRNGGCAFRPG
jgi:hypothetical protein